MVNSLYLIGREESEGESQVAPLYMTDRAFQLETALFCLEAGSKSLFRIYLWRGHNISSVNSINSIRIRRSTAIKESNYNIAMLHPCTD